MGIESLKDKVAVITGSSRGIGRAIARGLASVHVKVCCVSRNKSALNSLLDEINTAGGRAFAIAANLVEEKNYDAIIGGVKDHFGGLDIVVNNIGGVASMKTYDQLSIADWIEAFNVNFFSAVGITCAAIEELKKSAQPRIINIGSLTGLEPGYFNPHYAAAKAALLSFSKSLANFYAGNGILVNTICPGPIETESFEENISRISEGLDGRASILENEKSKVPLHRLGTPDEVSAAVEFLASDSASFISGACITVDGGKRRSIM